jgi:ADP-dependent NAD(P)H-hydrate dehydratase
MMKLELVKSLPSLPLRPRDGHKGTFGRVLVVGGSRGMLGAPVFAGTAALRMGSGLVQIAVPESVLRSALSITPELIGLCLESRKELARAADSADVIVVGPGLGVSGHARKIVRELLVLRKNIVVDADGLGVLAGLESWPKSFFVKAVLTPHPGEMAKLMELKSIPFEKSARQEIAIKCAKRFGQVTVLKGFETIVTDGTRVYVNHTGDTSLAKAGTGDVLSGIIASLIGQQMELFEAACLGVHLHGLAGEAAKAQLGPRSVLASDVNLAISTAILKYAKGKRSSQ